MVFRSAVGVIGAPYKLFALSQVCQPFQSPGFIALAKVLNLRTHRLSGAAGKKKLQAVQPRTRCSWKNCSAILLLFAILLPCYPVWMVEREPVLFPVAGRTKFLRGWSAILYMAQVGKQKLTLMPRLDFAKERANLRIVWVYARSTCHRVVGVISRCDWTAHIPT